MHIAECLEVAAPCPCDAVWGCTFWDGPCGVRLTLPLGHPSNVVDDPEDMAALWQGEEGGSAVHTHTHD